MVNRIGHYIGGKRVAGTSSRTSDVFDPNTGTVQAQVDLAGTDEVQHAIAVAEAAQRGWAATNPQRRARVLAKFIALVNDEMEDLARLLSAEHGKTVPDAKGTSSAGSR
nr:aldehyde dehydrogenase family protein [Nocardioides sambongensis]